MSKKLILILVGSLVVVGGGAATAILLFMRPAPATEQTSAAPAEPPGIIRMDPFVVNINDPGADRFAKLAVSMTVKPSSAVERITGDEVLQAKIRDRILTLLTSKSPQELTGPIGKEGLRREIKAHLTPLIDDAEIEEILFSDFVVQ